MTEDTPRLCEQVISRTRGVGVAAASCVVGGGEMEAPGFASEEWENTVWADGRLGVARPEGRGGEAG